MAKSRKNILGINLFHGWMRAVNIGRAGRENSWSAENQVKTMEEIRAALKEAVKATHSKASYASLVLDHDQLRHHSIDIPPMPEKDIRVFLKRKVAQLKEFQEDAVYSYTQTSTKDKLLISINYAPKSFINGLTEACNEAGLFLLQIMPFSSVRAQQFRDLEIEEDDMAVLVVKMFEKVSLIVGRKDGTIFSDRGLQAEMDSDEDMERIVREVKRSILYSKQQFARNVARVQVSERFQEKFTQTLKDNLDVPVGLLPKSARFFWIRELLKIPFKDKCNFIFKKTRHEMRIRKYTRIVMVLVIGFWIQGIACSAFVEYLLYQERKSLATISPKIRKLQNVKEGWEKRVVSLNQMKYSTKFFKKDRPPPVPGWFIGHLCNELPEGLFLTKSIIRHNNGRWEILIEGFSTSGHKTTAEELRKFIGNLQNGPFRIKVHKDWYNNWLKQLKEGIAGEYGVSKFSISGVI